MLRYLCIAAAVLLAGCTTVIRPALLPEPSRPVLTPVASSAVQCLAPDTYTALVNRERALREWGLAEEAVIRANNAKAKP